MEVGPARACLDSEARGGTGSTVDSGPSVAEGAGSGNPPPRQSGVQGPAMEGGRYAALSEKREDARRIYPGTGGTVGRAAAAARGAEGGATGEESSHLADRLSSFPHPKQYTDNCLSLATSCS